MSALYSVIKRHSGLCNKMNFGKNTPCSCGADEAVAELAAQDAYIARLEMLIRRLNRMAQKADPKGENDYRINDLMDIAQDISLHAAEVLKSKGQ